MKNTNSIDIRTVTRENFREKRDLDFCVSLLSASAGGWKNQNKRLKIFNRTELQGT